jgi:ADP-ribosylglycohydrolase/fructose-1,6-bisphosphatase/inositol monophosphatase family enzyme
MFRKIDHDLLARVRGTWLGQIAGDALGTTVEFKSASRIAVQFPGGHREIIGGGPFRVKAGQVTDDTELALGLARTLAKDGANFDAIAQSYVRWCRSRPFDIGMTTQTALRCTAALQEVTFESVSRRASTTSQANGSVMRISPLAIYGAFMEPEQLGDMARKDSRLTHPHPACQEASAAFARAIAALIRGESREEAWLEALRSAFNSDGREHGILGALKAAEDEEPVCDGKNIGWIIIALQNAFYHLLNAKNLEEGLVETVMAGGDTDTNGCIAGALLGAYYGEKGIPDQWVKAVLRCRTNRGPVYQNNDARELAVAIFNAGIFHHGERPDPIELLSQDDFPVEYSGQSSFSFDDHCTEEDSRAEDSDLPDAEEFDAGKICEELQGSEPSDYDWELKVVLEVARECGDMLLAEADRDGGPRGAGDKADIDDEMDEVIHKRLSDAFPNDTIISEEHGRKDGDSGRAFIVDPHDGTKDFLNGRRETSISIALVDHGQLVLGVVYAPFSTDKTGPDGMLASWAKGEPVRKNGRIVSDLEVCNELEKHHTVLVSTRIQGEALELNKSLLGHATVEHCASIATRLALVAVGDADFALTIGHTLADWDFAAGQALLLGIGGQVTGPSGEAVGWRGIQSCYQGCQGYFGGRSLELSAGIAKRFNKRFELEPDS